MSLRQALPDDFVPLGSQVGNAALQDVANSEESILAHTNTRRRSGCQNIAGNHSHVVREISQHLVDGKYHVARISLLLIVTVDLRPQVNVHWIDTRCEVRADWTVCRARF